MSQSLELATLKVEEEDLLKLRCLITENLNKLKVVYVVCYEVF